MEENIYENKIIYERVPCLTLQLTLIAWVFFDESFKSIHLVDAVYISNKHS